MPRSRPNTLIFSWLLTALLLAGCQVDTQIETSVADDGTVVRKLKMEARGVDIDKEKDTYPRKRYTLPAAPEWTITEKSSNRLVAEAKVDRNKTVPAGYARHVPATDRWSRNTVSVHVRDHFVATSYHYREVFADALKPDEFQTVLMEEYDRYAKKVLDEAHEAFQATHNLRLAERYVKHDLRNLVKSSGESVQRGNVWSALAAAAFRLAMGGFPMKNVEELMQADRRDILKALIRQSLRRMRLKTEHEVENFDQEKFDELAAQLADGPINKQQTARKELTAWGGTIVRLLKDRAELRAKNQPESGAARRLNETAAAIEKDLAEKFDQMVDRIAADLEAYYLKPPEAERAEREARLAKLMGAHIEGNFADIEYAFLVRARLPGEIAMLSPGGNKVPDGSLRWNFMAVEFLLQEKVCEARTREWKDEACAKLGRALYGPGELLPLKVREDLDEALFALDDEACAKVVAACRASAEAGDRAALEKLVADTTAPKAAPVAKKLLQEAK